MIIDFDIHQYGEDALLLQFSNLPSKELLNTLLSIEELLLKKFKLKARHTYTEVIVPDISKDTFKEVYAFLETLPEKSWPEVRRTSFQYTIPVCYEKSHAWDIEEVARYHKLTLDEVITMHSAENYLVYFIGFLPGFPYLLGMDSRLTTPRKKEPRQLIPQGSVAIGGNQTGVYPQESPAGWNIIGRTPVLFFNPSRELPSFLKSGDILKFQAVSSSDYLAIEKEIKNGSYLVTKAPIDG